LSSAADAPSPIKLAQAEGKIVVNSRWQALHEYRFAAEKDLPWARPYFYPVAAATGRRLPATIALQSCRHFTACWVARDAVRASTIDDYTAADAGAFGMQNREFVSRW